MPNQKKPWSFNPSWACPAECAGCWGEKKRGVQKLAGIEFWKKYFLGKHFRCKKIEKELDPSRSARSSPVGRRIDMTKGQSVGQILEHLFFQFFFQSELFFGQFFSFFLCWFFRNFFVQFFSQFFRRNFFRPSVRRECVRPSIRRSPVRRPSSVRRRRRGFGEPVLASLQ